MEKNDLKRCTRCVMPETAGGIHFDKNGVCAVCNNYEKKEKIDFQVREGDLKAIFEEFKGKGKYDCIVPYSGGKDSSYVLYICKKYGMNPLAYNFNNFFQTPIGRENMETIVKELGVDMVNFMPNWKISRKLMIKGLEKIGDFCWFCNSAVYATSIRRAIIENIDLVVFGEAAAEYRSDFDFGDSYEKLFRKSAQEGVPETEFTDEEISIDQLEPYTLPALEKRKKLKVIFLGEYIKWDKEAIVSFLKESLKWKEGEIAGASTSYEHIDCQNTGLRDYTKFLKRGFSRYTQLASIKVREGKMTREEALKEVERDGKEPENLNEFLQKIGISKEEYLKICMKHKTF